MSQRRWWVLAMVLVVAAFSLVACGDDSGDDAASDTSESGGVTVPADGGVTVDIVVDDESGTDSPMTMTVDPESVAAGVVTFVVENVGTIEHEVIVMQTDTPYDELTITDDRASEENPLGEVEVEEGETGSLTLDLEPGNYALVCNIAKHYGNGMRAGFTVT